LTVVMKSEKWTSKVFDFFCEKTLQKLISALKRFHRQDIL
jgi:hypothetical protein